MYKACASKLEQRYKKVLCDARYYGKIFFDLYKRIKIITKGKRKSGK